MIYREVHQVTKEQIDSASFPYDIGRYIPEGLGERIGRQIVKHQGCQAAETEDGGRIYSLSTIAFSLKRWENFLKELSYWMPEDVVQAIAHKFLYGKEL